MSRLARLVVPLVCLLVPLVTATSTAVAAPSGSSTRDVYQRPFAWNSVWNLPLARSAQYKPFDAKFGDMYADVENISVDPQAPPRELNGEPGGRVLVDPELAADGSWNNCSTLLADTPDRMTVVQGQPMTLEAGGDPSWDHGWKPQSLTGDGIEGCHGGSGMSGIGGTIREGELSGAAPLQHALKFSLPCTTSCSTEGGGFRWPAVKADSGYEGKYGGADPEVRMGSLLALPADTDLSGITEPDVRKVAEALKTYGGYVVDETGGAPSGSFDVQSTALDEFPNISSEQMLDMLKKLAVVTNSAPATPGGGALGTPRLAGCAGPFADGTGGAPSGC
ncbi:hypothetical protein Acsp06_47000 [Actinomycetospora sp. NBRC 106375]|uniref:hypothetical protein n=1 Tax=Actinomycetospora sp. NBRC 106375 TaxID=3032207 RepID=UPI0024A3A87A|nr:hypothetical protein [Actinomycetospora sp. NBRC 106375]GLZ48515.1 hypothetical protein Acsp06_47000 [Actinomycetospora sp. NBRC 106375]